MTKTNETKEDLLARIADLEAALARATDDVDELMAENERICIETEDAPPTDPRGLADWIVEQYLSPYYSPAHPGALEEFQERFAQNLFMRRVLR